MNLPADFVKSISLLLRDDSEQFLSALSENATVAIRLNNHKRERNPMEFNVAVRPVPWCENGFYLDKRPAFTFDPLMHSGYYYVQEPSSMFIDYLVKQLLSEPSISLDLCAAPGGKSLGLLSAMPKGSLLVSNEMVSKRAKVLSETLTKFGSSNSVVTNSSPKDIGSIKSLFDLILVDAPCSGEGMFRKEERALIEWSLANVCGSAKRQRDIVGEVWPSLKPGGILIYSTCTYNSEENEENVRWIAEQLGAEFLEVETDPEWGVSPAFDSDVRGYRFLPHKTKGEGLFVSILRKKGDSTESVNHKRWEKSRPVSHFKENCSREQYLEDANRFVFLEREGGVTAVPKEHLKTIATLFEQLNILSIGVELSQIKGSNFVPAHALAMSSEHNRSLFDCSEVAYEEAIAYLRNETLQTLGAAKGFRLLTYKNEPVGFVKNLGNRANNLYPREWRIRSSHLPAQMPNIFSQPKI